MIVEYLNKAMRKAQYKILEDDGSFFGEIPDLQGVWANSPTLEGCREELQDVLEGWILFRVSQGMEIPTVDGLELRYEKVS